VLDKIWGELLNGLWKARVVNKTMFTHICKIPLWKNICVHVSVCETCRHVPGNIRCQFCERPVCLTCVRQCDSCCDSFCQLCSTIECVHMLIFNQFIKKTARISRQLCLFRDFRTVSLGFKPTMLVPPSYYLFLFFHFDLIIKENSRVLLKTPKCWFIM
jgi:hypothetical protein